MKHPYDAACTCPRCIRESGRRIAQANTDPRHRVTAIISRRYVRIARRERAYEHWAVTDDGPGDYEINGPDPNA